MTWCNMVIIEDSDFNYFWECSQCKTQHEDKPQTCKNVANMMQAELDRSYREHECISDPF